MQRARKMTGLLVAALMVLAYSALAGSLGGASTTKDVMVNGPDEVLDGLIADEDVAVNADAREIGWVGVTVDGPTVAALEADPAVTVEPDEMHTLLCHAADPCDDGGGGGTTPDDQTPYGIEQIYDDSTLSATSGGSGVTLGHLDTGVDSDHPDLVNRLVFVDGEDKNGHGTHTAGTATADGGDGTGIFGVAPEASVRSYKVCNNGGLCKTSDIVSAINDCTNNGNRKCDVITYSIGSSSSSSSISDAVDAFVNAGGLFVAAAGNSGSSLDSIEFPAWKENTIAVAAIDSTKTVADFSSRGDDDGNCGSTAHDVDLAAAGVDVESTYPDDDYAYLDGTSMATPHVSGLSLKEWGGDGATTESNIKSNVEDITSGKHATSGCDPASGIGLPHVG